MVSLLLLRRQDKRERMKTTLKWRDSIGLYANSMSCLLFSLGIKNHYSTPSYIFSLLSFFLMFPCFVLKGSKEGIPLSFHHHFIFQDVGLVHHSFFSRNTFTFLSHPLRFQFCCTFLWWTMFESVFEWMRRENEKFDGWFISFMLFFLKELE